jgi:peptidoglycan/LPS O-acetylase OafA/YrhL
MLVILHHLQLPGFSGGFIGVDIFFVISGYLITSIILAELKKGSFTFGSFYKRRVIRLAPAYFTVLLVTGFFAYLLMLPAELEKFSVSALYSTFFSANFYMWDTVGGYFGTGAGTTPLLHLWSLAVEEQFYVIWPVTLLLLYRFAGNYLLVVLVLALLVGLGISEYGAINYRAAAYYLMPTRAFELLIGAVLAGLPVVWFDRVPLALRLLFSSVGLALVLYANVFFSGETWFPGLNALYPCVGAFLLIAFVRAGDPVLGRLLSNRVVVGIGKVSYPAYLWHWPIIAFLNLQLVELTPLVSVGVITATLLIATLTYFFIERPARVFRYTQWAKVAGSGFVLPAAIFGSAAVYAIQVEGMTGRFDEVIAHKSRAVLSSADDMRGRCNEGPVTSPLGSEDCVLGIGKPGVDILLVGDSHANHFSGMIDTLATRAGLRGYDVTQSNSPFLVDVERFYRQGGELVFQANFSARNRIIETELLPRDYGYVVLGGGFNSYFNKGLFSSDQHPPPQYPNPDLFSDAMVKTIEKISEHGSIPVLIQGNPTFDYNVSNCTLNNLRFELEEKCHMDRTSYQENFQNWNKFVDQLSSKFDQLIVIDPAKVMCNDELCYSELDDTPLYKDSGHLNYEGSKLIGELYIDRFGNPFKSATEKAPTKL